ncbi:rac GTPase-activating protein 1-like isoform X2 [Ascaphus truei]|uniref:rac GTPase-activating protein 1-like isoform X2 n=1 Tax=Ascaphus truei TaxID=8439 RepID=UPI003F5A8AEC
MNKMVDTRKRALQSYLDRLLRIIEINSRTEEEYIEAAQSFEASRKRWQKSDQELREKRETLLKCEIDRSALQVKLKHARNQVDVEMKKRHRAEAELEKTDLDELAGKPAKIKARERRRSSLAPLIAPLLAVKRPRPSAATTVAENIRDTVVAKTTMTFTEGGDLSTVASIEAVPRRRSLRNRARSSLAEQTCILPQINEAEVEYELDVIPSPAINPTRTHVFLSKTVIRSELCAVCGKKTRFGKMTLKCRDCRILLHPECRERCPKLCSPPSKGIYPKNGQGFLADFAPVTPPRIPSFMIQCVNEIEKRGLSERGIYRVPGCDRQVKDLRQRLLQGKVTAQQLGKEDIHAVCGALKDVLRNLREPLVTFTLHSHFMEAADLLSESDGKAEICQAVDALPSPNRDTLAFLILHLYRVMGSADCKMDRTSLSRVFGPTVVGYSVPEPNALMIMQDTPRQAKVMSHLLTLPRGFWSQFLSTNQEKPNCDSVSIAQERLFQPVTSPEINSLALISASPNFDLPQKALKFFASPN